MRVTHEYEGLALVVPASVLSINSWAPYVQFQLDPTSTASPEEVEQALISLSTNQGFIRANYFDFGFNSYLEIEGSGWRFLYRGYSQNSTPEPGAPGKIMCK